VTAAYLAAAFDRDGFSIVLEEALAHLRGHGEGDAECEECVREVVVCTGGYREHIIAWDSAPNPWRPTDVLTEHDLSSMDVAEAVVRLQQAKLIAEALNAVGGAA
jgi:hypothetical protein